MQDQIGAVGVINGTGESEGIGNIPDGTSAGKVAVIGVGTPDDDVALGQPFTGSGFVVKADTGIDDDIVAGGAVSCS